MLALIIGIFVFIWAIAIACIPPAIAYTLTTMLDLPTLLDVVIWFVAVVVALGYLLGGVFGAMISWAVR